MLAPVLFIVAASSPARLTYTAVDLAHSAIPTGLPGNADVRLSGGASLKCAARLVGRSILRTDPCPELWEAADPPTVTVELQGRAVGKLLPAATTPLRATLTDDRLTLPGKIAGEAVAMVVADGKPVSGWSVVEAAPNGQISTKEPITSALAKARKLGGRLIVAANLADAGPAVWTTDVARELSYSGLDLANKVIPLPRSVPLPHETILAKLGAEKTCSISTGPPGIFQEKPGDCPEIWSALQPPNFEIQLPGGVVRFSPESTTPAQGTDPDVHDDGSIQFSVAVKSPAAVFAAGDPRPGWRSVAVGASKTVSMPSADLVRQIRPLREGAGGTLVVVARTPAGGLMQWSYAVDGRPFVDTTNLSDDERKKLAGDVERCSKGSNVPMVVDATRSTPVRTDAFGVDSLRSEVDPNQTISVAVIAPAKSIVHASTKGTPGDFIGIVMNAPGAAGQVTSESTGRIPPIVACSRFAPRKPGDATVTVFLGKLGSDGKEEKGPEANFDLFVRTTYTGALRLGIGAILKGIDHAYTARTAPGSSVATILDDGAPRVNFEFVVAYAPFLLESIFADGRTYGSGQTSRWLRFAPYVGVALISPTSGSGIDWLKSIYAGGEYEFFPNFSIAATFVERRITHLAPGLAVGGPAPDNAQIATARYEPGFALVLNITPDFLRFGSMSLPK